MTQREYARSVVQRLRERGYEAYWAGGCVRDELLGLEPADYDVATSARPEQVRPLFRRTIEVGAAFGVVEIIGPQDETGETIKIQVATFRSDGEYSDGRRPDSVRFCSAQEDAIRRDFTINGMFYDPIDNRLIDYVGGQEDLQRRHLRAIGSASDRFREDKLRMLRAVRMAIRFDLTIEPDTANAIRSMADELPIVSQERIAEELRKMLVHPRRSRALKFMDEFGLLERVFPEPNSLIHEMRGVPQGTPEKPRGDLWEHTLSVMDLLEGSNYPEVASVTFPLAMGALLHDIGKRRTMAQLEDRWTFHAHEHVGKKIAGHICDHLKLSNTEKNRIVWLVEKHQYLADAPSMRLSRLKPILVHPGIGELLALHRADALATGVSLSSIEFCETMLRETPRELLDPAPYVTGDDLIHLGMSPGPRFKSILDRVREAQLEGTIRSREEALQLVASLNESMPI